MSRARSIAFAALFAATSLAAASARADEPDRFDLPLRIGAAIGVSHVTATGSNPPNPSLPSYVPNLPFASGDNWSTYARLAIGGAFEGQLYSFGAGLPRLLLGAGATIFIGNQYDGSFTNLHGGSGNDTSFSISRPFTVDLYMGGAFPLCKSPKCVELKALIGLALTYRTVSVSTDETSAGGVKESQSSWKIEGDPLLGVDVDIPLCKDCKPHPLRLRVGAHARYWIPAHQGIVSGTGKIYDIGLDGFVEADLHAGIVLPL